MASEPTHSVLTHPGLTATRQSYPTCRSGQLEVCKIAGARSDSKIAVLQVRLGQQPLRCPAPDRPSPLDDVVAVADARQVLDVLVDHQDRLAARFQHRQAVPDFL